MTTAILTGISCGHCKGKHATIADVRECSKPKVATPRVNINSIPVGEDHRAGYALEIDGVVKFFRVSRPARGKWRGWTFIERQASDDFYKVGGQEAAALLAKIATDPEAAATLYGKELRECFRCHRTLTTTESRERGMGKVCASKAGW